MQKGIVILVVLKYKLRVYRFWFSNHRNDLIAYQYWSSATTFNFWDPLLLTWRQKFGTLFCSKRDAFCSHLFPLILVVVVYCTPNSSIYWFVAVAVAVSERRSAMIALMTTRIIAEKGDKAVFMLITHKNSNKRISDNALFFLN